MANPRLRHSIAEVKISMMRRDIRVGPLNRGRGHRPVPPDTVEESTVKAAQKKFHGNAYRRDKTELTEVQVMGKVEASLQPISSDLNCDGWDWWAGC